MNKIIINATVESMEQFFNLPERTQFLYSFLDSEYEIFAIKIDNNCAIFLNQEGKFVVAKAYKNCLTLGSTAVREFNTLAEAIENKDAELKWIE